MQLKSKYLLVLLVGLVLLTYFVIKNKAISETNIKQTAEQVDVRRTASNNLGFSSLPAEVDALKQLPSEIDRSILEQAKRNPFIAAVLPQEKPKVIAVTVPPPPVAQPTVAAKPMAPLVNLSFVGRVIEADGQRAIFANFNNETLRLTVGQILPNGFRVDAINDEAVELNYPPLNTTARFDLPKPPPFEIR
jgi:hypothetical protein